MERLRPGAVRACMQYALQGDAGASQHSEQALHAQLARTGILGALTWHGEHADDLVELEEGSCEHSKALSASLANCAEPAQ